MSIVPLATALPSRLVISIPAKNSGKIVSTSMRIGGRCRRSGLDQAGRRIDDGHAPREVDLDDDRLGGRDQHLARAILTTASAMDYPHVLRGQAHDVDDAAEDLAGDRPHLEADDLEVIELALAR